MDEEEFKFIYGPVASWRLGSSLGIDLISTTKICTFNCIYCQLGPTLNYPKKRKLYVPTEEIIEELNGLAKVSIDYITFSGLGESTVAKNLGTTIGAIKALRKEPVAVLTNSSLMDREEVREELSLADFVIAKLDVYSNESLGVINRPMEGIEFDMILEGIRRFRKEFNGKLGLQIMFVEENKANAKELALLAREIGPDEVQINTPLRPCDVKPLSKKELSEIKKFFKGMNVVSVYDAERKGVLPISKEATLKRRGKI